MAEFVERSPLLYRGGLLLCIILAMLFGGGGAEGGRQNALLVLLGGLSFLVVLVRDALPRAVVGFQSAFVVILALTFILLAAAQLVPLPPSIWHSLAGREQALEALQLIGADGQWRPLSLMPVATLTSATFMLLPVAIFLWTAFAGPVEQRRALVVLVVASAVSGVIGAAQLGMGHPSWLSFYDGATFGAASGVFANPNHQALLMATAVVASAILMRTPPEVSQRARGASRPTVSQFWIFATGIPFFSLMALASGARAGVLLLLIALPAAAILCLANHSIQRWIASLLGIATLLFIFILVYPETNGLGLRESFRLGEDARYAFLPDILFTLDQYWPSGTGLGTFVTVFSPNENLDLIGRAYLNHAHNDLLEWALETGLAGILWLAVAMLAVLVAIVRKLRKRQQDPTLLLGAAAILLLVFVHSLADYPLRTQAIAVIAAIAAGIAMSPSQVPALAAGRARWPLVVAVAIGLLLGLVGAQHHLAQYAVRNGDLEGAGLILPSHPSVLVERSAIALAAGDNGESLAFARQAVDSAPLSQPAMRQLALARDASNQPSRTAWQAASALGWRDAPTQLWSFREAMLAGDWNVAALRAGALLRTQEASPQLLKLIRTAGAQPEFAGALAGRATADPPWRAAIFNIGNVRDDAEIKGTQQLLRALMARNAATLRDGRGLIAYYLGARRWNEAADLHQRLAGSAGNELLSDGGFNRSDEDYTHYSTPFDWRASKGRHGASVIDTSPPGRLVVDTDGESAEALTQRFVRLPAGNYTLSFAAMADAADAFAVELICASKSQQMITINLQKSPSYRNYKEKFSVIPQCSLIKISVKSLAIGQPALSEIDNFAIFYQ